MFGDGWWHMGWMWIFWVVFLVLIIWLLQRPSAEARRNEPEVSAEEILKRRYARGEIGREEYERKLEDVRK